MVPSPGVARRFMPARPIAVSRSIVLFFRPKKVFIDVGQRSDSVRQRNQQEKWAEEPPPAVTALHFFHLPKDFLRLGLVELDAGESLLEQGDELFDLRHHVQRFAPTQVKVEPEERQEGE